MCTFTWSRRLWCRRRNKKLSQYYVLSFFPQFAYIRTNRSWRAHYLLYAFPSNITKIMDSWHTTDLVNLIEEDYSCGMEGIIGLNQYCHCPPFLCLSDHCQTCLTDDPLMPERGRAWKYKVDVANKWTHWLNGAWNWILRSMTPIFLTLLCPFNVISSLLERPRIWKLMLQNLKTGCELLVVLLKPGTGPTNWCSYVQCTSIYLMFWPWLDLPKPLQATEHSQPHRPKYNKTAASSAVLHATSIPYSVDLFRKGNVVIECSQPPVLCFQREDLERWKQRAQMRWGDGERER